MTRFGDGWFGSGTFADPGNVWNPGDPWPGTEGGSQSPHWGDYVKLWIRAGLAPGHPFHIGQHANDRLDAGNVLAGGEIGPRDDPMFGDRLWVDLSCDTLDVEISGGATSSQGVFSKADAATLVVTLSDPDGVYDPLNRNSPYAYGGRSRLVPGVPVEAFAEVVDPGPGVVTRHYLFTGTADSWGEDWTPSHYKRQAKLVATDVTKQWVHYNRPEQPEQGAGETTAERIERLVTFFDWPGEIEPAPSSSVTLQATTLAQSGWELLNRTLDDELGYVYFTNEGKLRWVNRAAWFAPSEPVLALGCGDGFYDVLTETKPSQLDAQLRNAVYAARKDGVTQSARSQSSIDAYGEYDYKRTDLGLLDDAQSSAWAAQVLLLYGYPQIALENVTMTPALSDRSWEVFDQTFAIELITDLVRIRWGPADVPDPYTVDGSSRVVGFKHVVTRRQWETTLQLVSAEALGLSGTVFTLGSHPQDRLDAGFVMGFI